MAWYHRLFGIEEKLNPAQYLDGGKIESSRERTISYERMYEELEVVNRGVNLIVDDTAEIPSVVSPFNSFTGIAKGVKRAKIEQLLNRTPNPFQDINTLSLIHI